MHGAGHDLGEDESRSADEGAGDDEDGVADDESGGCGCKAGIGVEEGDDDGHVRAADGHDEEDAKDEAEGYERDERDRVGFKGDLACGKGEDHEEEQRAEDVLEGESDGAARDDLLQLAHGDGAAG